MSFCYLLNAVLLFSAVLAFIIAGFAGTFARSLSAFRYRLMLGPLGFLIVGSLARSITHGLLTWFVQPARLVAPHAGSMTFGSGTEIFESVLMLIAGISGVLAGIALGATLDRAPSTQQTYTIANYWHRRSRPNSNQMPEGERPSAGAKIIPISNRRKHPGIVRHISAISENE